MNDGFTILAILFGVSFLVLILDGPSGFNAAYFIAINLFLVLCIVAITLKNKYG